MLKLYIRGEGFSL